MNKLNANSIVLDAIFSDDISEEIISALLNNFDDYCNQLNNKEKKIIKSDLKQYMEINLRSIGPEWLKLLIEEQDNCRIKN